MLSLERMFWIDRYLGSLAVTLIQPFTPRFRYGTVQNLAPERMLAIKFWGMGSLALAAPSLLALKQRYPKAELSVLTLASNASFVECLPFVDRVLSVDIRGRAPTVFARLAYLTLLLHRYHFDLVLDFEFFTRFSAIVSFSTRAPVRVGFHAWEVWRGNLHNVRVPFNRYWHVTRNFFSMVQAVGVAGETPASFRPHASSLAKAEAEQALNAAGVSPRDRIVLFNPNAGELALERRWPAHSYATLARRLAEELEIRPVFIGSREERAYVEQIVTQAGRQAVNLAGSVSVAGLLALLERAEALITNDSGPLQLALAVDLPTLSFFGPETPMLYGPRDPTHRVLYRGLACSPCINVHSHKRVRCIYGHPVCLETIEVEQALTEARAMLARERGGRHEPSVSTPAGRADLGA
jgi:lipopolysaccharide heptosyltransferase II